MGAIGMTERMVRFSQLIVGRFKGGLAYVNVLASMLFGGVSGSALADVSALGPPLVDMMKRDGYDADFATAVTVTSAMQGPIIPPSIPFVIFASLTNVSVGALFLAGVVPGVMLGLGQMSVIWMISKRKQLPRNQIKNLTVKLFFSIILDAGWALMMPLIIIGGIVSGAFTATEAAAVAAGYAIFIGVVAYRNLTAKMMWKILDKCARTTTSIYLIVAFTSVISWILANERVPDLLVGFINTYDIPVWLFLLMLNLFFLFNGLWISDVIQLLLFAPLFTPILAQMGVHPVHFGVIMVVNVMLSMITPPYGTALYLGAIVGKVSLGAIVKRAFPFFISCIVVLLLTTYLPKMVLFFAYDHGAHKIN